MPVNSTLVSEFNRVSGNAVTPLRNLDFGDPESSRMLVLQLLMIQEEVNELTEAVTSCDRVGIVDALGDILYVAYGAGYRLGVNLDEAVEEIHRSNMTKFVATEAAAVEAVKALQGKYPEATYRPSCGLWCVYDGATGKILKPPSYSPPNLGSY